VTTNQYTKGRANERLGSAEIIETLVCVLLLDTVSKQHVLEACVMPGISGNMLKIHNAALILYALN